MSALALSVVLSLVSAVVYAGAAIWQEQVAQSNPDRPYAPMRSAGWWASVGLNGLGGLLHVVALAYGPLSVVQPLGALTIVFALPMAAMLVRRKAGAAAWRGALLATIGLAGMLALTGSADSQSLDGSQRLFLALSTVGAVAALIAVAQTAQRHPAMRSVLLAAAAGVAFGMSSVFTKTVAVDVSANAAMDQLPSLAAIGVFATAGVLLSQASYRGAGLTAPLATVTVVNPVAAAAVGLTMFGETFRYGAAGTVCALACGALAAVGLVLLTTERIGRDAAERVPAQAGPPDATGPAATGLADSPSPRAGAAAHVAGPTQHTPADEPAVPAPGAAPAQPVAPARTAPAAARATDDLAARPAELPVRDLTALPPGATVIPSPLPPEPELPPVARLAQLPLMPSQAVLAPAQVIFQPLSAREGIRS